MFKFLKDFIDKLGEENTKNYGSGKLDCCNLNRQTNNVKTAENKKK